jgi:hypothetical protein
MKWNESVKTKGKISKSEEFCEERDNKDINQQT